MEQSNRSRALRVLGGLALTSTLTVSSLLVSAPKAAAEGFSVEIKATGGVGQVDFTVVNNGNGDLVNCRLANASGESNRSLPKGQDWSGSYTRPAGTATLTVTCERNNNLRSQVSASTVVTVTSPYIAPAVPVATQSAASAPKSAGVTRTSVTKAQGSNVGVTALTGDESGIPAGAIVGLLGMLLAGLGSALGVARKL